MKFLVITALSLVSLFAAADSVCGGSCVNTTSHAFMNMVCTNAEVEGASKCQQFSMVGCAWKETVKKVVRAGSCVNGTKDRTLDAKCTAATPLAQAEFRQNGRACVKITGCIWAPEAITCAK